MAKNSTLSRPEQAVERLSELRDQGPLQSTSEMNSMAIALGNAVRALRWTTDQREFNRLSEMIHGLMEGGNTPGVLFQKLKQFGMKLSNDAAELDAQLRQSGTDFLKEAQSAVYAERPR